MIELTILFVSFLLAVILSIVIIPLFFILHAIEHDSRYQAKRS
jgi:hypothetical protein